MVREGHAEVAFKQVTGSKRLSPVDISVKSAYLSMNKEGAGL